MLSLDQNKGGVGPMTGSFRLASSKYKGIFAEKKVYYGRTLVMWVKRSTEAECKAGVVVSKRTFRRAVDRNCAKRLMRESWRLLRHQLKPQADVILIARAGMAGCRCRDVMQDLEIVCRRANLWRDQTQQADDMRR